MASDLFEPGKPLDFLTNSGCQKKSSISSLNQSSLLMAGVRPRGCLDYASLMLQTLAICQIPWESSPLQQRGPSFFGNIEPPVPQQLPEATRRVIPGPISTPNAGHADVGLILSANDESSPVEREGQHLCRLKDQPFLCQGSDFS